MTVIVTKTETTKILCLLVKEYLSKVLPERVELEPDQTSGSRYQFIGNAEVSGTC